MEVESFYSTDTNINEYEESEFNFSKTDIEYSDPEINNIPSVVIVDYKKLASSLVNSVKNVHASYLFVSAGNSALIELCKCISSTPCNIYHKSWKDLAGELSLSLSEIGCIQNRQHEDFTELVLKTFAVNKSSTLDKVVTALENIERYDALVIANKYFPDLASFAQKKCSERTKDIGKAFSQSLNSEEKNLISKLEGGILYPNGFSQLRHQLPVSLQNHFIGDEEENGALKRVEDALEPVKDVLRRVGILHQQACQPNRVATTGHRASRNRSKKDEVPIKKVLLTFAPDGKNVADEIAALFRRGSEDRPPIGVLILDEHADKINANPVHFITHQFAKMDYVIPILTKCYLDMIGKCPPQNTSLVSLDTQYIRLIHDLMSKYYVDNGCMNYKIRCVYPIESEDDVLTHPHMMVDPILKVYFCDRQIDTLIKRILKKRS